MTQPDMFGAPKADPRFDRWYAKYPRHDGKRAAQTAFTSALRRTTFEVLMRGLELYRFNPERQFQPMPATWLNRDDWDVVNYPDEVRQPVVSAGKTGWMEKYQQMGGFGDD